jgi:fructose-1-phosphate kinase PfkB-like protein
LDPAGDGLNISRALNRLEGVTTAILLLGNDPTAKAYQALLDEEPFEIIPVVIDGPTRSTAIIFDTGTKCETQITDEGAVITQKELEKVSEIVRKVTTKNDFVVFAGLLPKGAPSGAYAWLTRVVHSKNARVAVIASGPVLKDTLPARPDLVTLTQLEAESYFNYPVRELEDIIGSAQKLRELGADRVLMQMPDTGKAILATSEEVFIVDIPETANGTSSGVWDALVAGYLAGRVKEQPLEKSLALGAAAATYTASQVGQVFGTLEEVKEFAEETGIEPPAKVDVNH